MSAALRTVANLAAGSALAGTALLGLAWLRDRAHRWEPPRWEERSFVLLRPGPRAEADARPRWVVPVNLGCRRCLAMLRRLHEPWARGSRPEALVALIVDTPVRPDAAAMGALPPLPVWWDRDGIWRRRWGHRLYGELIEFDAAGRCLRIVEPGEAPRARASASPVAKPRLLPRSRHLRFRSSGEARDRRSPRASVPRESPIRRQRSAPTPMPRDASKAHGSDDHPSETSPAQASGEAPMPRDPASPAPTNAPTSRKGRRSR